ncbi:ABC transporter permease [Mycetocola zhadangensis]|uniref:ABC transporter permease n=1 Tax=Mycetocola zhadangensis TaxID=1164595 RepID=A0A3L7J1Q6_9MICO|nr:ABC transporter permease [Mycetocola zhadangensis]RLQ84410.1 ABC transporter permease [Mycetocola zhadangensis]GGE93218.1 ABC transporter permease [Mycetocola zhadangensis]
MTTVTPDRAQSTRPSAPSTIQATWLVAEREITMRLRSKAFLISTGILLLVVLASIVIGGFAAQNVSDTKVAVVGTASQAVSGADGLDVTEASSVDAAETLVKDGSVEAAIVPDSTTPLGIAVIGNTDVPSGLLAQLSISPPVHLLDENATNPLIVYFVALGFGLVFFMSAMTFGSTIAQNVVEEKQTRVVEILMSAIPVKALMAGKVLGNSVLAFGQIAIIAALSIIGLTITGQTDLLTGLGAPIVWFVVFFAIGFVLLASLFAATGSMVSRQEDIGATTTPVTMLVMIPYFLVIFFNDNPTVLAIMSYVPFSAPVGMPVRLFLGTAEWWEPLVSLVILIATTFGTIWLGSRIYQNSLLKMGARVKWGEALKS